MILNGLQTEILNTDNEHNIVSCGRGAGTTTGLILRAIKESRKEPLTLFVCPSQYQAKECFDKVQELSFLGGWRFSRHSYITTNTDTGGKIKFIGEHSYSSDLLSGKGLPVVIDNIHWLSSETAQKLLTESKQTFVSADSLSLGKAESWDKDLIKPDVYDRIVNSYDYSDQLFHEFTLEDYKEGVGVITGYSLSGNPMLKGD